MFFGFPLSTFRHAPRPTPHAPRHDRDQGSGTGRAEGGRRRGNSFIHPLSAFSLRPFSPLATSHWPLAPNPQSLIPSPHAPRPTPHASRLTPHASRPTPHAPRPTLHARRGIGLLEVLIAIFVLMIGLLGLAVLIVVGKLTLLEVERSDRTGACGRAALHEVKVRNLLNYNGWYSGVAPVLPSASCPHLLSTRLVSRRRLPCLTLWDRSDE